MLKQKEKDIFKELAKIRYLPSHCKYYAQLYLVDNLSGYSHNQFGDKFKEKADLAGIQNPDHLNLEILEEILKVIFTHTFFSLISII